ncbi:unnamed protein product [Triticum turgidum subsp. durum]|uniref:EGF-like domain-containing protein n=1 Tax=Triticum turgidum subsp. durum TaxID=4567 RepID=A0A9R0YVW3_TRITD|nr:unnamed protein product [Triticum turgidum subsp. durum]
MSRMATTTIQLVLIVFHLLVAAASTQRVALPGCRDRCGNVTVVYPFGIGAGCYRDAGQQGFQLECDVSGPGSSPPRLTVFGYNHRLGALSLASGEARAYLNATRECYNSTGGLLDRKGTFMSLGTSPTSSRPPRTAWSRSAAPTSASSSTPPATTSAAACPCAGRPGTPCRARAPASGAARARYRPGSASSSRTSATSRRSTTTTPPSSATPRCATTCSSWMRTGSPTATVSSSTAPTTSTGPDIDECQLKGEYPCYGVCTNTQGSYSCQCPPGTSGDATRKDGCRPKDKFTLALKIFTGVSVGVFLSVFMCFWLYLGLQKRKLIKAKQSFFEHIGGVILQP